uniref:CCHC-type domain-containing protein n=1 Tax=Chenopodium quinoa TaxID=63459 RepID=A0A803MR74_CHEQI
MAEEITDQWAKLKITAEEEDIAEFCDVDSESHESKIALSLIGKLITVRSFNFEAFQNTMKQVWSLIFHWRDKENVLDGALWNFDNQLLLLKEIHGDEQPESIEIKHCPFWIRLYNLPLDSRSDEDVRKIAEEIGNVTTVESDELGWDKSRRVRVVVDITKPLRRIQKIRNKKGAITTVQFKYERLSTFCFLCGILGHTEKDCTNVEEDEECDEKPWGLWLRASPRKGRVRLKEEVSKLKSSAKTLNFTHKPRADVGKKKAGVVPTVSSPTEEEVQRSDDIVSMEDGSSLELEGSLAPAHGYSSVEGKESVKSGCVGVDEALAGVESRVNSEMNAILCAEYKGLENMLVAELIDVNSGSWNVSKVRDTLLPFECERVLAIPLSERVRPVMKPFKRTKACTLDCLLLMSLAMWQAPPPHYVKVNVDAGMLGAIGFGVGVAARDQLGQLLWCASVKIAREWDPKCAEEKQY